MTSARYIPQLFLCIALFAFAACAPPVSNTLVFTASDIVSAESNDSTTAPGLKLTLTDEAAGRLKAFTTAHQGKKTSLYLGDELINSGVLIKNPITGNSFNLSGAPQDLTGLLDKLHSANPDQAVFTAHIETN